MSNTQELINEFVSNMQKFSVNIDNLNKMIEELQEINEAKTRSIVKEFLADLDPIIAKHVKMHFKTLLHEVLERIYLNECDCNQEQCEDCFSEAIGGCEESCTSKPLLFKGGMTDDIMFLQDEDVIEEDKNKEGC